MTEVFIDDDAVLWQLAERKLTADEAVAALSDRPLLLLMHGFGSFEGDLVSLAPLLPPGFVCASLRAPLIAPSPIVNGYAWWQLPLDSSGVPLPQAEPKHFKASGPYLAAQAVLSWMSRIDMQMRSKHGRGLGKVALMGFSQGGCMVTSMMRLAPARFSAGVNCSGFVAPGSFEPDQLLAALRPPLFWGRDEADPIIDARRIQITEEWSPDHVALEAHLYPGILHGIGAQEISDVREFLERHLPETGSEQL